MRQTKDNELLSSLIHFTAMLLSIAGLAVLVVFATLDGTAWHIVAFSIFGASLVLLYLASTIFHFTPSASQYKKILQKIDHSMIFILIAATYTPVCLIALRGSWRWSLFGVIWGLAILGIILKITKMKMEGWLSTLFYILMGWLVVIAALPLMRTVPLKGLLWLLLGGVFYTIGTIFLGLDRLIPRHKWFSLHDIFHLFVMAGSFSHFWLMLKYVLYI